MYNSVFSTQFPRGNCMPSPRILPTPGQNRISFNELLSFSLVLEVSSRMFINFTSGDRLLKSPATIWRVNDLWERNSTRSFPIDWSENSFNYCRFGELWRRVWIKPQIDYFQKQIYDEIMFGFLEFRNDHSWVYSLRLSEL